MTPPRGNRQKATEMHKTSHTMITVCGVLVVLTIQFGVGVVAYFWLPDWPTRGQFGDVFGAANALFSGLAFAGLIYAILLQREDLALQRAELSLNREELSRAARAQEASEVALRAQAVAATQSARLAAVNFLLEYYQSELTKLRKIVLAPNDPNIEQVRLLTSKVASLVRMLDSMFDDVSKGTLNK